MRNIMYFGGTCQSPALSALVRPQLAALQPPLDIKPFLPFSLDTAAAVNLFPNFNTQDPLLALQEARMVLEEVPRPFPEILSLQPKSSANWLQMDPIQKAVIKHTFGVPLPHRRKQIALCNICQLRFNSDSQAAAHYKGTKHAKKLKALEAMKTKQKSGATKDSAKTTFTSITTNTINTSSDKTDAAVCHQAVVEDNRDEQDSTFKILEASEPRRTSSLYLDLPGQEGSAPVGPTEESEDEDHHSEKENTESIPGPPAISNPPTVEIKNNSIMTTETSLKVDKKSLIAAGGNTCLSVETEEEKAKRLLYCSLCKVAVNSASQLEAHNSGTKHKTMVEARNGSGTIKAFPRTGIKGKGPINKGSTGLQNKTFHCEICDVHVNSETQLKQHISSRRHKDRAAGKPPKPKYSPYNKGQRGATQLGDSLTAFMKRFTQGGVQQIKLAFSKERSKPLLPRILPNHLAAAAAAAAVAANSPFSLRTAPAATLFQTSALPPALLRPAPGPIRTTHTPVLFAPY